MKKNLNLKSKIVESHPDIVLVYTDDKNYAAIQAIDASNMSEQDILQWKRDNPNYSTTEPLGKYFLLQIVEFQLESIPESDLDLAKISNRFLLTGGDFWHDHYIATGN